MGKRWRTWEIIAVIISGGISVGLTMAALFLAVSAFLVQIGRGFP